MCIRCFGRLNKNIIQLNIKLIVPSCPLGSMWTVLENMSGQGNTVGGKFSELKSIIDKVGDQTRVGVCLDTCHAFAAGE